MGSTNIFKILLLFMCFVFQDVPFLIQQMSHTSVIHPLKKSCDWPSDPHTFLREGNYTKCIILSVPADLHPDLPVSFTNNNVIHNYLYDNYSEIFNHFPKQIILNQIL